ncbi:hypothetical protein M8818_002256 [Zalaria obscura]|uniref:Uncharacterized protein n=1 Tax=Zalaria obscura TaxID=2024903 RepID=A0ACC3SIC2_9PEZI
MRFSNPIPLLFTLSSIKSFVASQSTNGSVDLSWYAPAASQIDNLNTVINGSGVYGFIFNSSVLPRGTSYGTYDWCNMPHVRAQEYPRVNASFSLQYVEVIHRHHKRTPYAANTFPIESYPWYCDDEGLFYYGKPLPSGNGSADTYWSVYTSSSNPLAPQGFNGTCQFPQITRGGLDDSWQHGKDLYGVYHDLLDFIPKHYDSKAVSYRVTNNVITSQVAGMLISGMYPQTSGRDIPLLIQPDSIDSLEPAYTCTTASNLYSAYGSGSNATGWLLHLNASAPLYASLDALSGVSPTDEGFHMSWDHYFDNLSSRLCHAKPLPCNITNTTLCVTEAQAEEVFRLGEYEYSYIYRAAGPETLQAAVGSYGIWVAELAENLRHAVNASEPSSVGNATSERVRYRHNVAHDGSLSRLLAILQVETMVWPGMGSEVVFELYEGKDHMQGWYLRVLWGGQVLRSSNPSLGVMDLVPVQTVLDYFDGLVGVNATKIPGICNGG